MNKASAISQIITVFSMQMRLYFKSRLFYLVAIITAVVPIVAFSGYGDDLLKMVGMSTTSAYLLILLPLMAVAIPSLLCGKLISSEFKDRTIYLNLPLPMSRMTFYIGKFLSGFVTSVGIILLAMGFAVVAGQVLYEPSFPNDIGASMLICACGVFAVSAMAFGLGTYFKRGAAISTMFIMLMMPFVLIMVCALASPDGGLDDPLGILKVLPIYAPQQSLWLLDHGIGGSFFGSLMDAFVGERTIFYVATSTAWGIGFLALGALRIKNKEM